MIRTESMTEANFPLNNSDAESHNRFLDALYKTLNEYMDGRSS